MASRKMKLTPPSNWYIPRDLVNVEQRNIRLSAGGKEGLSTGHDDRWLLPNRLLWHWGRKSRSESTRRLERVIPLGISDWWDVWIQVTSRERVIYGIFPRQFNPVGIGCYISSRFVRSWEIDCWSILRSPWMYDTLWWGWRSFPRSTFYHYIKVKMTCCGSCCILRLRRVKERNIHL